MEIDPILFWMQLRMVSFPEWMIVEIGPSLFWMQLRLVIFPEWKILGRREMRSQARRSTFAELFDAFATGR